VLFRSDSGPGCPTPTPLRGRSGADARGLVYDDAVKAETDPLYPLVADFVTPMEWPAIAPLVAGINRLKKAKNAVILAHNYMTPDIFSLVGDFRGDSLQLAREAADCGVAFLSTPVTEDWIPLLSELGAAIKIASGDLDFELVIRGAARTGRPVILSVGLVTIEEIDRAVNWVQQEAGENALPDRLALLHCVSAYPTPIEQANVRNIDFLRDRYGLSVGYSNHVIGPDACLAAVARGAQILEIHFTDQKEGRTFRDHSLSMDAEDLATLIPQAKRLRSALGTPGAMRQPCEIDNLTAIRKTIVAARPLAVGTVLSMSDLMFVRPRNGLACHETERVLGQCLKQAVAFGDPILPDHFRPS